MLKELNFEKKFENDQQYIDRKFFKESEFTKLSLSHIKNIIDARIQEMMNYLFNKNTNIDYFKNRLSHFYIVFENKIFNENFGTIFKNHLNISGILSFHQNIRLCLPSLFLLILPIIILTHYIFREHNKRQLEFHV